MRSRSDLVIDRLTFTVAEEAVTVYRRLAAANPDAYEPDLAASLNNVSGSLADAGRHDDALVAIEEAAAVYRRLAAANPAYEPVLAASLNNLWAAVVRRHDALVASVDLDNVWDYLAQAGRHEGLDAIEEAVAIYRRLAAADPAAYEAKLAGSLNNLAASMADAGRRQDGRAASEEAVGMYRRLAAANPAAYELDLAASLHRLSVLELPDKPWVATALLILLIVMGIARACAGIALIVVPLWQELKGQQPLR